MVHYTYRRVYMTICLQDYNVYEKFDWLDQTYGSQAALEMVLEEFDSPGIALERLVIMVEEEDDRLYGDMLTWFLERSTAVDAIDFWIDCGYFVEEAVDRVLEKYDFTGLDDVDDHEWFG
jgi:hypothetical protein